jgi:hypothetical protein
MVAKTIDSDGSATSSLSATAGVTPPRLRGPSPEDAWRVTPMAAPADPLPNDARLGSGEHLLVETPTSGRGTLVSGMVLAVCILLAVLAGMAILSHGNGPIAEESPQTAAAPR